VVSAVVSLCAAGSLDAQALESGHVLARDARVRGHLQDGLFQFGCPRRVARLTLPIYNDLRTLALLVGCSVLLTRTDMPAVCLARPQWGYQTQRISCRASRSPCQCLRPNMLLLS